MLAVLPEPFFLCLVVIFGLCIGSFLNVVIHRLPLMLEAQWQQMRQPEGSTAPTTERFNLMHPPSRCPHCGHRIRSWENIPIISYAFLLRGKCSNCSARISLRYPLVELATGLLLLLVALNFGQSYTMLGFAAFTVALICLTMIDWDTQLLPDDITLPLLWLGLLFNALTGYISAVDAIIGAACGYLSLWSIFHIFRILTGKEGMGYGDFKLLAALGAWLGWQALPEIVLLSAAAGSIYGVAMMLIASRDKEIPFAFGPFLAIAGWISMMAGDSLRSTYLAMSGLA